MKIDGLNICGDWITIATDADPGDVGEECWSLGKISVHPNVTGAALLRTIFHEAAHVASANNGTKISEREADMIGDLIHGILRDNPGLQNKWYGKEK